MREPLPLSLEHLRSRLQRFQARRREGNDARAAVAAIAREGSEGVELLLIRRADNPGDPWSGHMAFPGGRVEPGDPTPLAAAERETLEEIGLDLRRHARRIGRLSDVPAVARGRRLPLVIEPYVFELPETPPLVTNREVEEVVWMPLAFLADRGNRSTMLWRGAGVPLPLPCYRFEGRLLWGLTLQMVDDLLACLAARR